MPKLILIETSTSLCSTALVEGEEITCVRESSLPREHASKTAVFISEMLEERGLKARDCDAVCVSSGPGSYTGLRVGSSSAKGLCFGADIPLISIGTLDILAWQAVSGNLIPEGCRRIIPMIDARRMEVYCAAYSIAEGPDGATAVTRESDVKPVVVTADSFSDALSEGPVLFIGDGAEKCRELLDSPDASFVQTCPHARSMLVPALEAWKRKRFENTAYFEPFYLKEFVATVSRKNLLQQP